MSASEHGPAGTSPAGASYRGTDDYIAGTPLAASVNAAIALGRPLLVKGEPGTGKTLLAHSVAQALGRELLVWNIKSTTKARDGLYHYDVVRRLNDSRFGDRDVSDIRQYIELGVLGRAFRLGDRAVLLIDEVDKADIEFPNDLLHELDAMSFDVAETGETVKAATRPVVIITSNAEKELPDAFLRRCVFHYIEFPDREMLERIVRVHIPDLDKKLLDMALARFRDLREHPGIRKRPSTSELIDWLLVLLHGGVDPNDLVRAVPFLGVLLKSESDQGAVQRDRRFAMN